MIHLPDQGAHTLRPALAARKGVRDRASECCDQAARGAPALTTQNFSKTAASKAQAAPKPN
ncbi:MAG TPA: hypothetical protein VGC55_02835, partial [Dokdonella sp.]